MYFISICLTNLTNLVNSNFTTDSNNIVENTEKSPDKYDMNEIKKIYDEYKKEKLNQMTTQIKEYQKQKQVLDNIDTSIVYFKFPGKLNGIGTFIKITYIIKNISDNELEQLGLFIEDNNKKIISDFVILNKFGICIGANKNFKKIPQKFEIDKKKLYKEMCEYSDVKIIDFNDVQLKQKFTSFVCKKICRNKNDYDFFSNQFYLIK